MKNSIAGDALDWCPLGNKGVWVRQRLLLALFVVLKSLHGLFVFLGGLELWVDVCLE